MPSYRLLLVEDSADDAELLLHSLRAAPFKFTAVRVETEAEYNAALAKELPDVVLSDFNPPRFSTDRALKILNECRLDIPFIVVSNHIGEDILGDRPRLFSKINRGLSPMLF
ncbi:MAG: response regulator, partial [Burkholderiales bacterium]|nr:response regulator [Burkholderiales bacterium]